MIFCTVCGRPRNGPVRYCTTCGAPFPDGESSEPAAAEPARGARHRATDNLPDTVAVDRPPGRAVAPAHSRAAVPVPSRATGPAYSGGVLSRQPAGVVGQDRYGYLLEAHGGGRSGLAERFGMTAAGHRAASAEPPYLAQDLPADLLSAPAPDRRRKAAVAALAAAVILIAAAGGVDVWLTHRQHAPSGALPARTRLGKVSPRASGPASARAPSSAPTRAGAPGRAVSARLVTVAPGINSTPGAARVRNFLVRYFTAINNHNYPQFQPLLSQAMQQDEPATKFYPGYQSTTDSAAVLTAISGISPGLVGAAVSFTSHQLPADSPSGSACTNWSIKLYLSQHGSRYELEPPPPGYHAVYQPC